METKKNGTRGEYPHPVKSEVTVQQHGSPVDNYPSPGIPRSTLYQAWTQYTISLPEIVGKPYEYWGSLTYKDHAEIPVHHMEGIVSRRFRFFMSEVNKRIYGKRWIRTGKGVWGVYATEKIPDYPHHHFLMGGEGLRANLKRLEIMNMWEGFFGGWARVQDYRGEGNARYLCKYVSKGGIMDIFAPPMLRAKLKS